MNSLALRQLTYVLISSRLLIRLFDCPLLFLTFWQFKAKLMNLQLGALHLFGLPNSLLFLTHIYIIDQVGEGNTAKNQMQLKEFISGDPDPGINYVIPKIWYNQVRQLQEETQATLQQTQIPKIKFESVARLELSQYKATFSSMMELVRERATTKTVSPPMLPSVVYDDDYALISSNGWREMLALGIKSAVEDISIGMAIFLLMDYPEEQSDNTCIEVENFIVPPCQHPIRLIIQQNRSHHFHLVYLPGHLYLLTALEMYIKAQGQALSGYYCFPLIGSSNFLAKQLDEIMVQNVPANKTLIVYNQKETVQIYCHQDTYQSNIDLPRQNQQLVRIYEEREKSNYAVASETDRINDFEAMERVDEADKMINIDRYSEAHKAQINEDEYIFYEDGVEYKRKTTQAEEYRLFNISIAQARQREKDAYASELIGLPTEVEMDSIIQAIIKSIRQ